MISHAKVYIGSIISLKKLFSIKRQIWESYREKPAGNEDLGFPKG